MKILVMYDYPPSPGGLATQGDLLFKGLLALGVDAHAVHFESAQEKEWYYRWFGPDLVLGVGYWGHTPHLVFHPQRYGVQPVPWLVADGYMANYREVLNALPLILVTSNWVKEVYVRDGLDEGKIEVLPVGCDTDSFCPRETSDPKVSCVREALGVAPDQLMVLTVGGDAASKGAQEVMQGLALIDMRAPDWKYVCKVWPQPRTEQQNLQDLQLATHLGIEKSVVYTTSVVSRNFMPYLLSACDIYAAPSRIEGFGMPQVEAGACGKPVIGIRAMAMLDTIVHGETGFLAGIGQEIRIGPLSGASPASRRGTASSSSRPARPTTAPASTTSPTTCWPSCRTPPCARAWAKPAAAASSPPTTTASWRSGSCRSSPTAWGWSDRHARPT
jgi:starch synthase